MKAAFTSWSTPQIRATRGSASARPITLVNATCVSSCELWMLADSGTTCAQKASGATPCSSKVCTRAVIGAVNAPANATSTFAGERSQASAACRQLTISMLCQVSFTKRLRIKRCCFVPRRPPDFRRRRWTAGISHL
ncbi:MAG TPA: hypothetical protein VG099_00540 [Gemmataceae bacterium]|nr:hypothetical protein [Gemmataceae bacterium]